MTNIQQGKRIPIYVWALAMIMLLWMVVVVTMSQWQMSPTYDEQNHVTRGISVLRTGDFRLIFHHPPLANILEALPVAWRADTHFSTNHPYWTDRDNLGIWEASNTTIWKLSKNGVYLIKLARIPMLLFTVLLGLIIFLWSSSLFGHWGGILSLGLYVLDPNMIAHSGLATTDIPAACTILLAVYLLRQYFLQPSRARLLYAGAGIGIALASKFSALILIPLTALFLLLMLLLPAHRLQGLALTWQPLSIWRRFSRAFGLSVALGCIAGVVVWAVYGFQVEPLGSKHGKPLSAHASLLQRLPVPGKQYFRGLKTVKEEAGGHRAYLLGQTDASGKGWWYYFPIAVATKTPIPELIILLGILALVAIPQIRERLAFHRPDSLFLLLPIGLYSLAALGVLGISLNLGIRHILPIYPFLFILAGGWVALRMEARYFSPILAVLLTLQVVSVGLNYPNYLAYFNEMAGGSDSGYLILADSNYDWGQDLGELAKLQHNNDKLKNLYFSYFGTTPPEAYGISCHPLAGFGIMKDAPPPPHDLGTLSGFIAISATNLVGGQEYSGYDYRPLLKLDPYRRVGKTILIYWLPSPEHREAP